MARRYWTCRKCGHRNDATTQKCRGWIGDGEDCNNPRPKRRKPAHAVALELSFDRYAELQREIHGVTEDVCGLCGKPAKGTRHDRDHCHASGYPRGLLCWYCNKKLGEVERGQDGKVWLRLALAYLERVEAYMSREVA